MTEWKTDKRRILELETGPRPWLAALLIGCLLLACTAIAGWGVL